jgi:hypothetical protein
MRLGLVYLPEKNASDACERLSAELVANRSARVQLGPGVKAHITLLHVETEEDPASLWSECGSLDDCVRLDLLALAFLRYDTPYNAPPAGPATMAWLIVPATRFLRAAEQHALALPSVRRARVTTANDDAFQPHVTVAIWEGDHPIAPPKELAPLKGIEARLALGTIGANGVYERTLFSC